VATIESLLSDGNVINCIEAVLRTTFLSSSESKIKQLAYFEKPKLLEYLTSRTTTT